MKRTLRYRFSAQRCPDGQWLAEICELPGVLAYGVDEETSISAVLVLALQVVAERIAEGELEGPSRSSLGLAVSFEPVG